MDTNQDKDQELKNNFSLFVNNLQNFLSDLNRYQQNIGCQRVLDIFERVNMNKILVKYLATMRPFEQKLNLKDESIFSNKLVVVPGLDMSLLWHKLTSGQKAKIWIYLQILYVNAELVAKYGLNQETDNPIIEQMTTNIKVDKDKEKEFDPYTGIGQNNLDNYNVNDIMSGTKNTDGCEVSKPGLGSLANLVGIDKMLNLDELKTELQSMTDEDVKKATEKIQNMLGSNNDPQTNQVINNMLSNIRDELKNEDISTGNPIDNIMKIADSVALKIKPQMEESGVDIGKIFESTQNLADNIRDENGNPVFTGENNQNPYDMLNNIMKGGQIPPEYLQMMQMMGVDPNVFNRGRGNNRGRGVSRKSIKRG
jgi:hypothetical protein